MNNLIAILKVQLFSTFRYRVNKFNSKKSVGGFIKSVFPIFLICLSVAMLVLIYKVLSPLTKLIVNFHMEELFLLLTFGIATLFCFVQSIYKSSSYLFHAKDYEMLSSLPIQPSTILITKIVSFIFSNYLFVIIFMFVPSLACLAQMGLTVYNVISLVLMTLLAPIIPVVISSIITYIIGRISIKMKFKNLAITILSLIIVLCYMFISFNSSKVGSFLIQNNNSIINNAYKYYPISHFLIDGLRNNNPLSVLIYCIIQLLFLFVFSIVFAKGFKNINLKLNESYEVKNYKLQKLKTSSPIKSLTNREIKRYLSSYVYMLNTSIGMVILLCFSIAIIILGHGKVASLVDVTKFTNSFLIQNTVIITFCMAMTCTTNVSVSLEGKNFWIVRSLPINELDFFKAKINLNLILVLPISIICVLLLSINSNADFIYIISMVILIISLGFFVSLFGIILNLNFPKMNYTNEVQVVKRSISSFASIILNFVYFFIYIIIAAVFNIDIETMIIIAFIITLMIDIVLWYLIKTVGVKLLKKI